jgi:hypothetical protein
MKELMKFEIHHVEQFHADDDRDESEWDHPEDIGMSVLKRLMENILGNMMRCIIAGMSLM